LLKLRGGLTNTIVSVTFVGKERILQKKKRIDEYVRGSKAEKKTIGVGQGLKGGTKQKSKKKKRKQNQKVKQSSLERKEKGLPGVMCRGTRE